MRKVPTNTCADDEYSMFYSHYRGENITRLSLKQHMKKCHTCRMHLTDVLNTLNELKKRVNERIKE